ncbi:MAG TPA: class I SAM-dependent methyltransferase [Nocardioidaceae bacterium]|nr:class I SAM-dependent methyltransferase [Nocardioidaceae bacterium]
MPPDLDRGTQRRLSTSFDSGASTYAASRPAYPVKAGAWLVGDVPAYVLDLAAGTGALTSVLEALGHHVVAAEHGLSMLSTMRSTGCAVPSVQARAEALPFAPGSFDAVTVATAFHWFDAAAALPQIASVLRTGGRLGLVWNTRDEPDVWPRRFGELLRSVQPDQLSGNWATASVEEVRQSPLFERPQYCEFRHTQEVDRDGLIGLVASRSYVTAMELHRRRELFERVGQLFDAAADGGQSLGLPYRAQCWVFDRR